MKKIVSFILIGFGILQQSAGQTDTTAYLSTVVTNAKTQIKQLNQELDNKILLSQKNYR